MASASSLQVVVTRQAARRRNTIDEALDLAVDVMTEQGVGGLTMSEVARRLGMRQPSLYKYFPSLHAVYDALFARGLERSNGAVQEATARLPAGVPRLRAGSTAWVRWAVANPALAQLLVWRPVPGFEPRAAVFARSIDQMEQMREEFAAAVRLGQLRREAASDEALRLYTVVLSGLVSQQLANDPGATFGRGRFSRLTNTAFDLFFQHYSPTGDNHADARS